MKLSNTLVVLDLETTGTWVERDKIIEIAMIKCMPDGGRETYDKRVNPGMPIPGIVSELTGITNEDVKDAPAFKDIAGEVMALINEGAWEYLDAPPLRLTAPDTPVPYAPSMEEFFLPGAGDIVDAARQLVAY